MLDKLSQANVEKTFSVSTTKSCVIFIRCLWLISTVRIDGARECR